jgi:hypothetical protein
LRFCGSSTHQADGNRQEENGSIHRRYLSAKVFFRAANSEANRGNLTDAANYRRFG